MIKRKFSFFVVKIFFLILTVFSFLPFLIVSCNLASDVINIAGSSSMFPLFSAFSSIYSDADLSVESGGSTSGMNFVLEGKKDFGNVSKNLDNVFLKKKQLWAKKKIKTVTIGIDGIAIVYKKDSTSKNQSFNITQENIFDLYQAFAGTKEVSYRRFGIDSDNIIKPYARIGAASVSGTAEAFLNGSHFDITNLDSSTREILSGKKQYGKNVVTTPEPNSQAWSTFINDPKSRGSGVIYLSAGYVYKNIKIIEENNCAVAKYNNINLIDENKTLNNVGESYLWYREYNSIFSLEISDPDRLNIIKNFAYWIAMDKNANKKKRSYGVIPLKEKWLMSMFKDKDMSNKESFFVPDSDLGYAGARV